jgi:hypothetical protein
MISAPQVQASAFKLFVEPNGLVPETCERTNRTRHKRRKGRANIYTEEIRKFRPVAQNHL